MYMFTSVTEYAPTIRSVFVELPEDAPLDIKGSYSSKISRNCIDIFTISGISMTTDTEVYDTGKTVNYLLEISTYDDSVYITCFYTKDSMEHCYTWLKDIIAHRSTYEDGTILTYEYV